MKITPERNKAFRAMMNVPGAERSPIRVLASDALDDLEACRALLRDILDADYDGVARAIARAREMIDA